MQAIPVYPGLRIETKESVNIILNETPCNLQNSQRLEALVDNCFVGKVKFKDCNMTEIPESIYIQSLKNKTKTIKGVGTALVQRVIELSFKRGFGGKITLKAAHSSHVFYWKLGFRIEPYYNPIQRFKWEKELTELAQEMHIKGITADDKSVLEDPRMIRAMERYPDRTADSLIKLARKNDYKHEIILKAIQSGIARADTSSVGYTDMYLPEESIQIWKAILEDPSTKEENFKKLANIPQPRT